MGPCTQIVSTLAPKHLYRDYFKASVYTIRAHGPLGVISIGSIVLFGITSYNPKYKTTERN